MSQDGQQPRDTATWWARSAHRVAVGSWALAAFAPGLAAALAQYASLADVDPDPLNTLAVFIVCIGLAAALLGWLFWAIVQSRLHRVGYRSRPTTGRNAFAFFLLWIIVFIAGAILAPLGGNSDSLNPLALIALGLGITCIIGGFLGIIRFFVRMQGREMARHSERRARLRETATQEGREVREPTIIQLTLGIAGAVTGGFLMLGNALSGVLLAHLLTLPIGGGLAISLAVGALLFFCSLRYLIVITTGEHALVFIPQARAYTFYAASSATATLLLMGILIAIGLGLFAIIPLVALIVTAGQLRKRYLPPGGFV